MLEFLQRYSHSIMLVIFFTGAAYAKQELDALRSMNSYLRGAYIIAQGELNNVSIENYNLKREINNLKYSLSSQRSPQENPENPERGLFPREVEL